MKDKIIGKNVFKTSGYLYLFLLIMPFFIISIIGKPIKITPLAIAIISFIYALISALLAFLNYKTLNKLNEKEKIKRSKAFRKGILVLFTYFFIQTTPQFPSYYYESRTIITNCISLQIKFSI